MLAYILSKLVTAEVGLVMVQTSKPNQWSPNCYLVCTAVATFSKCSGCILSSCEGSLTILVNKVNNCTMAMLVTFTSLQPIVDGDEDDGELGDNHKERTPTPNCQQQTTMNLITSLVLPFIRLTYGLMYPAYCSFKAVKTKDVREYVNWMMYWIAFALFSVIEVFADTFVGCWFPFYYEGKIIFLLWMISSSTRGGAVMYRRYIHPALLRHEEEIDACLADFKAKASSALMKWGYRVLTSASEIVMSATFRTAEPLIDNFRRTYSMNDINRGYGPRYLGPPPGSSDLRDRFGPMHPGDMYFDRNVPAQPYGDVDMGDGSDANNVDRAAVAPGNNIEASDGVDNRRLRSSTRKRHVEMSTNLQGNLQRKKEKSTKKVVKTDRTARAPEKNA